MSPYKIRSVIVIVRKMDNYRIYDGLESYPKDRFDTPQIGDRYHVTLQTCHILGTLKINQL